MYESSLINKDLQQAVANIVINPFLYRLEGSKSAEVLAYCATNDKIFNDFIVQLRNKSTNISEVSKKHLDLIIDNLIVIHNLSLEQPAKDFIIDEAKKLAERLAAKDFIKNNNETLKNSNPIPLEIENCCYKLQFFLSQGKNGGAEIIMASTIPKEQENIFIKICDSLTNFSQNLNDKQKAISYETVEILKYLRNHCNNSETIRNFVISKAFEAAELAATKNYIKDKNQDA